jgi:ribonuclease P protein subunit POP4
VKRTRTSLAFHELIGLEATVTRSAEASLEGVSGVVIDETLNLVRLEVNDKVKTVPKATAWFSFKLPDSETVILDGRLILGRPQDRIARLGR